MNYRNVHFRLESGYRWGIGLDQSKSEEFHEEINNLFIDAGWEIKQKEFSCACPEAEKGKNRLYLHPMDASGELQEDMVSEVEEILSKGKTFKHYHTDIYEILYDMSDEEYQSWLNERKENIEKDILEAFATKRKNLFITNTSGVIQNVKEKYHLPRVQQHINRSSNDIEWKYTRDIFEQMIKRGKFAIAETKNGLGYRTINN